MSSVITDVRPQPGMLQDEVVSDIPMNISQRLRAYSQLAKPRIAFMVLVSAAVGYLLGGQGVWSVMPFFHASIGIVLAVVSASTFNQYVERDTDALMSRTRRRPLPMGILTTEEVLLFGIATGAFAVVYLWLFVNPLTSLLTLGTIVSYSAMYTPLKRWTPLCTVVGAVPGAMPPVLGWAATGNSLDWMAFSLFALLFVWQFPHFLAIAWMYHDEYRSAGLKMVPGAGRPKITGTIAVGYALVLVPVSLLPVHFGFAGQFYGLFAVAFGLMYIWYSIRFLQSETRETARRLLFASFIYLPNVLLALSIDHIRLLN